MLTPVLPFPRPGFVVEHVATADATRLMAARARTPAAACPHCPPRSARVHRRLQGRRCRCPTPTGPRRPLAARLPALAPCHAQRTGRLTATVRGLGRAAQLAHGCPPACGCRGVGRPCGVCSAARCLPSPHPAGVGITRKSAQGACPCSRRFSGAHLSQSKPLVWSKEWGPLHCLSVCSEKVPS